MITRPNTRQSSHGWFGRSGNVKTARNSEKFVTYLPTDTARCRVACPRLKISRLMNFCHSRAVHIGGFERIKKWKKVKDSEPGIQQHISQLNYFTAASNSPVHSISLVSTQNRQKQKPRVVQLFVHCIIEAHFRPTIAGPSTTQILVTTHQRPSNLTGNCSRHHSKNIHRDPASNTSSIKQQLKAST